MSSSDVARQTFSASRPPYNYGNFYTNCVAPQEQYNEFIDPICLTPSTRSSSSICFEQDLLPRHGVLPNHTFAQDQEQQDQEPTGVFASQTPGLPHLGIDVEATNLNAFFMNPFAASFPGDLPFGGGLVTSDDFVTDYEAQLQQYGSEELLGDGTNVLPLSSDSGYLQPVPQTRSRPSSRTSSPLVTVTNASPPAYSTLDYGPTSVFEQGMNTSADSSQQPALSAPTTSPCPPSAPAAASDTSATPAVPAKTPNFQFVDASDRKTIMKLRNTMVSRKHRDNKVKRIAELERLLEEKERECEELRKKLG